MPNIRHPNSAARFSAAGKSYCANSAHCINTLGHSGAFQFFTKWVVEKPVSEADFQFETTALYARYAKKCRDFTLLLRSIAVCNDCL
jgi:hypothetical protein